VNNAATIACNAIGTAIILVTSRDVLRELFHPGGSGGISSQIQRRCWQLFKRLSRNHPRRLRNAGPVMLVAIVLTWGMLFAFGWALVYWPYLPQQFRFSTPIVPATQGGFSSALYVSLLCLTTMGFGDVTPVESILRVLVTVEGAIGVGLLTAGISWILSLYPVLSRRRTLAQRVMLLDGVLQRLGQRLSELDPLILAPLLGELAAALAQANIDLGQSGISYYFWDDNPMSSLAVALPALARMARGATAEANAAGVRVASQVLYGAVEHYAHTANSTHLELGDQPLDVLLGAYARDHYHDDSPTAPRG
jgi:hypothetical protein